MNAICACLIFFILTVVMYIFKKTPSTHAIPIFVRGNPSNNQLIPLHIYQTSKSNAMDELSWNACVDTIKQNPEYTYHLFDDKRQRDFIKNNMPKRVLRAYDKLIPTAYKADLWRYCILYVKGGVYLDVPMKTIVPLKDIIKQDDTFVSVRESSTSKVAIYNAFMASVPNHPFLREVINDCVNKVENNYIGDTPTDITGPAILGKCMNRVLNRGENADFAIGCQGKRIKFKLFDYEIFGKVFDENKTLVIYKHYPLKKYFFKGNNKQYHYFILWGLAKLHNDPSYIYQK